MKLRAPGPSKKRLLVAKLHAEGKSYNAIAKELGLAKSTVAYHARRLGIPADDKASRRYDWTAIQEAYDSGLSVRECALEFGFCLASWNAAVRSGAVVARPVEMPLEALLVVGRPQTSRYHLKQRLLKEGVKENPLRGVRDYRMARQAAQHAAPSHQRRRHGQSAAQFGISRPELPFPDRHLRWAQRAPTQATHLNPVRVGEPVNL